MSILYSIFIRLLAIAFRIGSIFSDKLMRGWKGRKESLTRVREKISKEDKVIWMHAASLGEYEQGVPVLEKLKQKFPAHKVLVTFFSPSGYDVALKKDQVADVLCYLPFDKKKAIRTFTSHFRAEIFFTVKYDFWYHLLQNLKEHGAKTYTISALFYPKQIFFTPIGKWFVSQLINTMDWFFHQNQKSFELGTSIGIMNASVSGDTRFDRVKQNLNRDHFVPGISEFKKNRKLLIFGSSWEAEHEIAKHISEKMQELKIIIAPHDMKKVNDLQHLFPNALLYSKNFDKKEELQNASVLIIDSIGLLSKIYSYGNLAFVGGGFHKHGLHNILEAAVYGIPVFFGNHYQKNPEADQLILEGGGTSFETTAAASTYLLEIMKNDELLYDMGQKAGKYIEHQNNATESIVEKILSN